MDDASSDAHQIAVRLRVLPVMAADDQKVLAANTIAEIKGRLDRCFESHRENADDYARARRPAGPIRVAGRSYPSGHAAAIGEAYSLLDRLWFYLDPEGRDRDFQPKDSNTYDPCPTAWHAELVANNWPKAKAVILDRLNDQWRQDFVDIPVHVATEAADHDDGKPAVGLNDTEQSICEAISRLWEKGLEWPNADDIATEAGLETQTVKNNAAPLARHGILEKGHNGRGYKVRT